MLSLKRGGGNLANFAMFLTPGKSEKSGAHATFATFLAKIAAQRNILKSGPLSPLFCGNFGPPKVTWTPLSPLFWHIFNFQKWRGRHFFGSFHHRWRKWRWRHFRHFVETILNLEKWRRRHFRHFYEKILTLKKVALTPLSPIFFGPLKISRK